MTAVSGVATVGPQVLARWAGPPSDASKAERVVQPSTNLGWLREVGWEEGHLGFHKSDVLHAGLGTGRLPLAAQHITVQMPADPVLAANAIRVLQRYFSGNSTTQSVRVEGVVTAAFLAALKPMCPNLRVLDLSDCAPAAGRATECVHLLAHFNQLHELNLDLKTLSQAEAEAALEALGTDASSPLVTLRLFGCDRLDLVRRDAHRRLFALPQLRSLQFFQVASEQMTIGTRWAIVSRRLPEPFRANGVISLVHRTRPALPPVIPNSRNQIILPT